MFIRTKKIKNQEYAYLVKSVWKKRTARQKVVKYLGRVHNLPKTIPIEFQDFCTQQSITITPQTPFKESIQHLMTWTLAQHGFKNDPFKQQKWLYNHCKIIADPAKLKVHTKKRDLTIKANDGYMNEYTLKQLLKTKINKTTEEQRQAATILANAFVSAGINVPQDIFIIIFQQLYK
jgi:hypothetical protein